MRLFLWLFAFLVSFSVSARAEEVLHLYNWADYTPPALIEKFEKETGIKVILDVYDNNETMLAKLQAGNADYDIVVPTDYMVEILRKEGLIQKVQVTSLDNWSHVKDIFVESYWDPKNEYSVPFTMGLTSFSVNRSHYDGDINTLELLMKNPAPRDGVSAWDR